MPKKPEAHRDRGDGTCFTCKEPWPCDVSQAVDFTQMRELESETADGYQAQLRQKIMKRQRERGKEFLQKMQATWELLGFKGDKFYNAFSSGRVPHDHYLNTDDLVVMMGMALKPYQTVDAMIHTADIMSFSEDAGVRAMAEQMYDLAQRLQDLDPDLELVTAPTRKEVPA